MLQVRLHLTAVVKQVSPRFSLNISEWCLVTDVKRTLLISSKDKYCQLLLEYGSKTTFFQRDVDVIEAVSTKEATIVELSGWPVSKLTAYQNLNYIL